LHDPPLNKIDSFRCREPKLLTKILRLLVHHDVIGNLFPTKNKIRWALFYDTTNTKATPSVSVLIMESLPTSKG